MTAAEKAYRDGQENMRRQVWRVFRKFDFKQWDNFKAWSSWLSIKSLPKRRQRS